MISTFRIPEQKQLSASPQELRRSSAGNYLAVELGETAKLALPMVVTQLGQVVMMTTDLVFLGRMGTEALAAAALAGRVYLVFLTFGLGLLAAIVPIAAQAFGADNVAVVLRSLRMALCEAVLLSLPIIVFALQGEQILLAFGQEPNVARLAQQYLSGLAWGVMPALCFQVIRSFMGAINRPRPILWIMLGATPINALLVYLLIHGKLGLPRLEMFGAGLATSAVNCGMFLTAFWFIKIYLPFCKNSTPTDFWRFDWPLLRQLIAVGTPISMSALIGYGSSSVAALLAGWISTTALAAHQIAVQVSTILFMISYGVSTAAAVRVSHAVGRNDGSAVKRTGLVAIQLGIAIAAIATITIVAARSEIANLFLGDSAHDADATRGLAAKLLLICAISCITDTVATVAMGALRGLKDTRTPLFFACTAYLLIGISLSYVFSLRLQLGAVGIWLGLSIGSTIYAGLLASRFCLLANATFCRGPSPG